MDKETLREEQWKAHITTFKKAELNPVSKKRFDEIFDTLYDALH